MEVFILMRLRGVRFVTIVDTGFTGVQLVRICAILKNGIDSIGFVK